MTKGAKLGIVALIGIGAFLVYWFIIRKGGVDGAVDSADAALVKKMNALASQNLVNGFPDWIVSSGKDMLASGTVAPAYYIKGKATLAAAIHQAYDSEYYGYGYAYKSGTPAKNTGEEYNLHEGLWQLTYTANA